MAIREFTVGPKKGLRFASAAELSNLVAIAGPNGGGKSSLLELLWAQRHQFLEPGTEALYVGPHRTWRGGALTDIIVRTIHQDFEDLLKQESMPGLQYGAPGGNNWLSGLSRMGSNADDSQAFVKASIARIANKAQAFVFERFESGGRQIAAGSVPDLFEPLSELIETLLPHLDFVRVDQSEPQNIRVMFAPKVNPHDVVFDIDDLSSGEKAAIALFLPFIERRVKQLMATGPEAQPLIDGASPTLTLLLDEPEIHLHPLLQLNMLDYMRRLGEEGVAQFIFTTHSPTMLDALENDELYLLSPAPVAPLNQLSRLSDSLQKLEVARSITGATHLLTRGKPILFVEGEPDVGATASDQRLIKLLLPETQHWAVVPSHGKSQVTKAVADMRSAQLHLPGMPVFGLVDRDTTSVTGNDYVIPWPVAMVENLLLDAEAINTVASAYAVTGITSASQVAAALGDIVARRREEEIRLRLKVALPTATIRVTGSSGEDVALSIAAQGDQFRSKIEAMDIVGQRSNAVKEVDEIIAAGEQLERFHGKAMLTELFQSLNFAAAGISVNVFKTEVARHAAKGARAARLTKEAIAKIKLYFPEDLHVLLRERVGDSEASRLADAAETHRVAWVLNAPTAEGRELLRQEVMAYVTALMGSEPAAAKRILESCSAIGTAS